MIRKIKLTESDLRGMPHRVGGSVPTNRSRALGKGVFGGKSIVSDMRYVYNGYTFPSSVKGRRERDIAFQSSVKMRGS